MFGVQSAHTTRPGALGLLLLLLLLLAAWAAPSSVQAQDRDTVAPIIELEELSEGVADRTQVFTVQIAEDTELEDAVLFYRREGQLPFTPAPMQALGNTGYYSVSIPTDNTDLRTIEYYVQARDIAGNRTVSGFAFDPYRRTLKPALSSLQRSEGAQTESVPAIREPSDDPPLLRRRWVQITLGVLAVGAIATLASDSGEDKQVAPLTFNLP